jgi:hypothetical protein
VPVVVTESDGSNHQKPLEKLFMLPTTHNHSCSQSGHCHVPNVVGAGWCVVMQSCSAMALTVRVGRAR